MGSLMDKTIMKTLTLPEESIEEIPRKQKIMLVIGKAILFLAAMILLIPFIKSGILQYKSKSGEKQMRESHEKGVSLNTDIEDDSDGQLQDKLFLESVAYNERIFAEKQKDLTDEESFTQIPVELEHLETDKAYAYLTIEKLGLILPVYVGTSEQNLAKGLAVMGETSLPIGMSNANCVIAGHRGYHNMPFLRHIDRLEVGDTLKLTNNWDTLLYTVEEIEIIEPDDLSSIYIQKGRDMITLLSCHPVHSGGKQRYLVKCVRDTTLEIKEKEASREKEQ